MRAMPEMHFRKKLKTHLFSLISIFIVFCKLLLFFVYFINTVFYSILRRR